MAMCIFVRVSPVQEQQQSSNGHLLLPVKGLIVS